MHDIYMLVLPGMFLYKLFVYNISFVLLKQGSDGKSGVGYDIYSCVVTTKFLLELP